jgi:hypothetical protein
MTSFNDCKAFTDNQFHYSAFDMYIFRMYVLNLKQITSVNKNVYIYLHFQLTQIYSE